MCWEEEESVSINIEIWLTIKIIIMRKQPHPAVTLDHYKHSNTDKLRRADGPLTGSQIK